MLQNSLTTSHLDLSSISSLFVDRFRRSLPFFHLEFDKEDIFEGKRSENGLSFCDTVDLVKIISSNGILTLNIRSIVFLVLDILLVCYYNCILNSKKSSNLPIFN